MLPKGYKAEKDGDQDKEGTKSIDLKIGWHGYNQGHQQQMLAHDRRISGNWQCREGARVGGMRCSCGGQTGQSPSLPTCYHISFPWCPEVIIRERSSNKAEEENIKDKNKD